MNSMRTGTQHVSPESVDTVIGHVCSDMYVYVPVINLIFVKNRGPETKRLVIGRRDQQVMTSEYALRITLVTSKNPD